SRRRPPIETRKKRGRHLTGSQTIVANTAGHPLAIKVGMNGAVMTVPQVLARLAGGRVEGKLRTALEAESNATQAEAAAAIAAQWVDLGHERVPGNMPQSPRGR